MAILVDRAIWRWRGRRWAHLVSDRDLEELHAFAARLGLARAWFQGDHYDVPETTRARALTLGAQPVDSREVVRRLRRAGLRRPHRRPPTPRRLPQPPTDARAQSWRIAGELAERAGAVIVDLDDLEGAQTAGALANEVWGRAPDDDVVGVPLLRALAHAGNHLQGVVLGDRLVAMVLGFLGLTGARPHLHSHLLAVAAAHRGAGLGRALKQSQRAWALERGITTVTWTFDPLVVRNAELNLRRLGAVAGTYLPAHYGAMDDVFNAGDATDRLLVTWELDSPRAWTAADGAAEGAPRAAVGPGPDAAVLLKRDGEGPGRVDLAALRADEVWCAAPCDINALRARDRGLAGTWREAVRSALQPALRQGFMAVDATRDGWYLLRREQA